MLIISKGLIKFVYKLKSQHANSLDQCVSVGTKSQDAV